MRTAAVTRVWAIALAVLLSVFLVADPAGAQTAEASGGYSHSGAGSVPRATAAETLEPDHGRRAVSACAGPAARVTGAPRLTASPTRTVVGSLHDASLAAPASRGTAPAGARSAGGALPLSRSAELPIAHQAFRC
ncbi:hypothetical protein [Streptomyces sp. H27-D2]|uniref:hypothetical protein n=1 Tax=Streptomyces sp. H27-D2 TaxID=3046304 RepID=UPI002DBEC8E6|nr:hypothetical protein [Streptomyces sp. H27-D2]MEC4020746.1 hypothetical protein [Streptomyces sp. H27-D2]